MIESTPYPTAAGVEAAIKDAARKAFARDATVGVGEHVRQTHFDRFLCRVFSEGLDSEWLVKGGTGMLARVPQTRATKDVDLFRAGYDLKEALDDHRCQEGGACPRGPRRWCRADDGRISDGAGEPA